MNWKNVQRMVLAATLFSGVAAAALAQIPVPPPPPLPGIEVRIATGRPPTIRPEVRYERPGPDYIWVEGFWHWDGGRWNWIRGRWERRVEPQAYWITPRYVRTDRGYIYEPGHWSNQTVIVAEDIRSRKEWKRHEKEHERELKRERERERYYHEHNP